jgi:hypothetical protein
LSWKFQHIYLVGHVTTPTHPCICTCRPLSPVIILFSLYYGAWLQVPYPLVRSYPAISYSFFYYNCPKQCSTYSFETLLEILLSWNSFELDYKLYDLVLDYKLSDSVESSWLSFYFCWNSIWSQLWISGQLTTSG